MEYISKNKNEGVFISTRIDAETNQMLIRAAKLSRRSKQNEMAVRLKDHLMRLPYQIENFEGSENETV